MNSTTEVANIALRHIAATSQIADLATDSSEEARSCRAFYDIALDETLSEFPWPFATRYVALAQVEENPTEEWLFSYRYPPNCQVARRIVSGDPREPRSMRIPFRVGGDDLGKLIYCSQAPATLEFTARITAVPTFPNDFANALAAKIASYIATGLTGGDPFKLSVKANDAYNAFISKAKARAGNEEEAPDDPESELETSRG